MPKLNIKNIQRLLEHLKFAPTFYMNTWATRQEAREVGQKMRDGANPDELLLCKTPACVAGHAAYLLDRPEWIKFLRAVYADQGGHYTEPKVVARKALGLSAYEAEQLFYPHSTTWLNAKHLMPGANDRQIAIALLENFARGRRLKSRETMPDVPWRASSVLAGY